MPRSAHFPRQRTFVLPAVLAGAISLGLATALPVAAHTAPQPVRPATTPAATAALPPATAAPASVLPLAAATTRSGPAARVAPASPGVAAAPATARWVALDIGHVPGGGGRSDSGVAEHNFNLRFASALEARLQQQGVQVRRLPTSLSLADRARRAHGAALVVSVHHDATSHPARAHATAAGNVPARQNPVAAAGSGFQLRVGQAEPLACARAVASQLQTAGRHFSTGGFGPWADKTLGVRAGGEGALLHQVDVPVLQVSLADIANPAEERLAGDATWLVRQAAAVAKGVALCLQRRTSGAAPAALPAAVASGPRRA